MEPNKESKKPRISYRYYELPEGELVQAITGDDWVCTYGTYAEDVHFHNVMEIGICRWGQGFMVLEDRRIDYTDGAIMVVPANCLHTTLSKDKSLNSWEYLFFDPQGILNSAFPNDPLFVETVLHRLSSQALCLPKEDAVELEKLITMVLHECQSKQEYHKAVEQNLMASLLLLIARTHTEKKSNIRPMMVGLQQIMPAIEHIGLHYMNPISGEELASICSLSEAQLRRKFKEYLNMTPGEYLTIKPLSYFNRSPLTRRYSGLLTYPNGGFAIGIYFEIPTRRHLLRPTGQQHGFRTKRNSPCGHPAK